MSRKAVRVGATVAVAAAALLAVVLGLARVEVRTDMDAFLPHEDPVAQEYRSLTESFGGDPLVVLVEVPEANALLSPGPLRAVVGLEGRLAQLDDVAVVYGPGTLLNQVAGRAQDLLAELFGRRDAEIAAARAQARGSRADQAAAVDAVRKRFDARYGPLLVQGLPAGLPTLGNEAFVRHVVLDGAQHPRGQWKFVVPDNKSLAITVRPQEGLDAERMSKLISGVRSAVSDTKLEEAVAEGSDSKSAEVTVRAAGASVMVSALSDRAVRDVPILGGLAIVAVGACFLCATWVRRRRRLIPVATTLAALVGTLAVMGWLQRPVTVAVIAFLPVLLGIGCYYPTYLAMRATPRTLATVVAASACSLGTLALSPLPLVRDVGLVLGLGVLFAGVSAWSARRWLREREPEAVRAASAPADPRVRLIAMGVLAAMGVIGTVGWVALGGLSMSSDVDEFASGLPQLAEARHVEMAMGSSGEVSIALGSSDVLRPEGLAWMRHTLGGVVNEHGDQLKPIVSPPAMLSFLGPEPTAAEIDAAYRLLPPYLTGAVLTPDRSMGVLTFGVDIDDLAELRSTLAAAERQLSEPPAGYESRITGLPLVLMRAEDLVSADRYRANILGIATAGVVLLIGLRRRLDALRGVLAASLATGAGFGLLSLTGGGLNPITGALGALTAAVGCEFTVMLAESTRGRGDIRRAVPLVAASSAAGYLVLLASGLEAVRSFGLFLALGVGLALLCSWAVVRTTIPSDGRLNAAEDRNHPQSTHDEARIGVRA